ncbi:MAG: cation transporter [Oscillospiraceae bacterium]|jgi:copper chaperone CopZ|nr:cation transporter [Bacillota bacterium]MBR0343475.1 cation transporter [Oscillospiraceae bacterium]MBR0452185.1 cation transporter [Oscillospiraceae bacterium]
MKKKFKIEVDCANCAAKVENAIKQIDGIEDASVGFMTQKMMITAPDEKFDEIMKEVERVAKKIEPDFEILG